MRRIEAEAGQDLAAALLALPPRDLRSLLLYVLGQHEATPAGVLADYERLRAVQPSYGDPRAIVRFEAHALLAARAFEAVELSPVVPLGAARALGGTHPNNVIATIRGVEIAGDPTTALALEAARRRRGDRAAALRLATIQRVMRMQPVPPPLLPHFKLFALVTAGRQPDVLPALREHLAVHLDLAERLREDGRFSIAGCVGELSDPECVLALLSAAGVGADEVRGQVKAHQFTGSESFLRARGLTLPRGALGELDLGALSERLRARLARLWREVIEPLAGRFPAAVLRLDLSRLEGIGYYTGPTLRVTFTAADGATFPVADGGVLPWTSRILGDGRERLVASGMGVDVICSRFV